MAAPHEDIARRLAARLAPEVDKNLPALVVRALAEGDAGEGGTTRVDGTVVLALATWLVSLGMAAWNVTKDLREQREKKQQGAALTARVEELERDVAYFKGAALSRLRIEVEAPAAVPLHLREAAYEAAVEEALAQSKRHEGPR